MGRKVSRPRRLSILGNVSEFQSIRESWSIGGTWGNIDEWFDLGGSVSGFTFHPFHFIGLCSIIYSGLYVINLISGFVHTGGSSTMMLSLGHFLNLINHTVFIAAAIANA